MRILVGANGSQELSLGGDNGTSKTIAGSKVGSFAHGHSPTTNAPTTSNYDGEGTYLFFNVRDTYL